MVRRGPRGDLDRPRIVAAAEALVSETGDAAVVSLRSLAERLGVTPNALYTYYPSVGAVLHDVADERLGGLQPDTLLRVACAHCALIDLFTRATTLYAQPGTLSLLKLGPVMGPHSFRLSETVMALCAGATTSARDAHDLIMGWFYGSASLAAEGWTAATDQSRLDDDRAAQFPLVATRAAANPRAQFDAILAGLGLAHHAAG